MNWLKKNFGWLFVPAKEALSGEAFVYCDGAIPSWALLGQYDVRTATARNTAEYIWLPTEDGSAIPIGMYKGGELYAIHADHLGTPRLITDRANKPVWQWPYSGAFGGNPPVGLLATTASAGQISTRATKPRIDVHLRFPGQYWDEETNLAYNRFRTYDGQVRGGYIQFDPIELEGGLNRSSYVGGSPLMYSDPMGLQAQPAACAVGFAFGGPLGCAAGVGMTTLGTLAGLGALATVPSSASQPARPSDITREEERHWDRHCRGGDPCGELKKAINAEITGARQKMNDMLIDKGSLFGGPGWGTHRGNLNGRLMAIWNMINLARKMGCEVSAEEAAASTLFVPLSPK